MQSYNYGEQILFRLMNVCISTMSSLSREKNFWKEIFVIIQTKPHNNSGATPFRMYAKALWSSLMESLFIFIF